MSSTSRAITRAEWSQVGVVQDREDDRAEGWVARILHWRIDDCLSGRYQQWDILLGLCVAPGSILAFVLTRLPADFVFRRLLRGEEPFTSASSRIPPSSTISDTPPAPSTGTFYKDGKLDKKEVGRILLAGGLAGSLSAVIPYPCVPDSPSLLDIH